MKGENGMPEVIFNGPAGRLDGRYHAGPSAKSPIALVLHPHPQHGGTMNNKIVYALYHQFANNGLSTLRFNFRGVGRSEGNYDQGEGELADAAAALDWLQFQNPQYSQIWIGGFSFGSWIAMQLLMRRPELSGFIAVSPPAHLYDFNFLAPCPISGKIIQGISDGIVPVDSVDQLVKRLRLQRGIQIDYDRIPGADHFFTQHMDLLSQSIQQYLSQDPNRTKMCNLRIAG